MALQFFVEGVSTKLEQESLPDLVQIWAQFHSLLTTKKSFKLCIEIIIAIISYIVGLIEASCTESG